MYSIEAGYHKDRSDAKGEGRALAALILASGWPHPRKEKALNPLNVTTWLC